MKNLLLGLVSSIILSVFVSCGSFGAQIEDIGQSSTVLLVFFGMLTVIASFWSLRLYRNKKRLAQSLKDHIGLLAAKNEQLEGNNAFHQKLISIISHDLRQPLTSMMLLGEEHMMEQMSSAQRQYVFNQISQNARTSLQAMDGLVHWMKLYTIGLAYTPSIVSLKENMVEALDYNRAVANQKGIAVIDFIPETTELLAQSEMLLFVNRNIISNALRHTPNGGRIVVTADLVDDGSEVVVRIMDSGEGIPAHVLPNLFAKERSESALGGSGLALIICHEMIEKMNGRIWAVNNEQGGACICYSLSVASSSREPILDTIDDPFPLKIS